MAPFLQKFCCRFLLKADRSADKRGDSSSAFLHFALTGYIWRASFGRSFRIRYDDAKEGKP